MSYQYVIYEKKGQVAHVTINRPEVMNALYYEANVELGEVFNDFKQDGECWVAIVMSAGQCAFSAGNDLKATAAATARGEKMADRSVPFGGITTGFVCSKPIIAAVNGVAVGGGVEIALAGDLIIAAEHARFGLPEPRVGLIAGAGGVHRLPQQLPLKQAMGMLLTGRQITAQEAYRIGLVNEVVPGGELMAAAVAGNLLTLKHPLVPDHASYPELILWKMSARPLTGAARYSLSFLHFRPPKKPGHGEERSGGSAASCFEFPQSDQVVRHHVKLAGENDEDESTGQDDEGTGAGSGGD